MNTKIDVASLSGGRTSGYMAHKFITRKSKRPFVLVFMDTGFEHPKTYEFIRNIAKYWGVEIVCLRAIVQPKLNDGVLFEEISIDEIGFDLTLFKAMIKKHSTPDIVNKYCTDRLKTTVCYKWANENFGS